jgi:hypothetical protein
VHRNPRPVVSGAEFDVRGVARTPVEPGESVTVTRHDPQRVELRGVLTRPGLVVPADTFYPGWALTVDGRPAPILRTNHLMRGAAVEAGEHTLVYVYDPLSFKLGLAASLVGLAGSVVLLARPVVRRRRGETSPPLH